MTGFLGCAKRMDPMGGDTKYQSSTRMVSFFDDFQYKILQDKGSEIQYDFTGQKMPNIKVGDVLIQHKWPDIHQLCKIAHISIAGDLMTVRTVPRDMSEVGRRVAVTKGNTITEPIEINEFVTYDDGSVETTAQLPEEAINILTESTDVKAQTKWGIGSITKRIRRAGKKIARAGSRVVRSVKRAASRYGKRIVRYGGRYNLLLFLNSTYKNDNVLYFSFYYNHG